MVRCNPAKSLTHIVLICLMLTSSGATWSLTPSAEADRLLLAAEEAFANGSRRQAEQHLNDALKLGITLPADFNFLYGKLLVEQGKGIEARRYLEQYVNRVGDSGRYYRDALLLITDIQKQPQPTPRATASNGGGKAEIRRADANSGSYVDYIRNLYGTQDAATALTQHINNLLKFYAYGDQRVVASTRAGTPSRHKLQYSSQGEIISFNQVGALTNSPFKEDRFSVYGVNPHVSFQCRAATSSCWLYHPVTSQRWLQIVNNEEVALEMSKALSQLIRNLQKSA